MLLSGQYIRFVVAFLNLVINDYQIILSRRFLQFPLLGKEKESALVGFSSQSKGISKFA